MYNDDSRNSSTPKRRSSFARDIAAAEFGGRYHGWRDWGEFEDLDPETLAEKRIRAIWGGAK